MCEICVDLGAMVIKWRQIREAGKAWEAWKGGEGWDGRGRAGTGGIWVKWVGFEYKGAGVCGDGWSCGESGQEDLGEGGGV
jgi:hypothetical protein